MFLLSFWNKKVLRIKFIIFEIIFYFKTLNAKLKQKKFSMKEKVFATNKMKFLASFHFDEGLMRDQQFEFNFTTLYVYDFDAITSRMRHNSV